MRNCKYQLVVQRAVRRHIIQYRYMPAAVIEVQRAAHSRAAREKEASQEDHEPRNGEEDLPKKKKEYRPSPSTPLLSFPERPVQNSIRGAGKKLYLSGDHRYPATERPQ